MDMSKITQGDGIEQHCTIELSAVVGIFYINAVLYNNHEPLVAIEHLKCLVQLRN